MHDKLIKALFYVFLWADIARLFRIACKQWLYFLEKLLCYWDWLPEHAVLIMHVLKTSWNTCCRLIFIFQMICRRPRKIYLVQHLCTHIFYLVKYLSLHRYYWIKTHLTQYSFFFATPFLDWSYDSPDI